MAKSTVYPIVYLDCIVVKVRHGGSVINKAVFLARGINTDGQKELLGMWLAENEGAKFWVSNVDDYDYKIEYLKFEEGTPFPEEIHRNPHVAYKVDDLEKYIADADSVICGPMAANDKGDRLAFVWKDGAILELYQEA